MSTIKEDTRSEDMRSEDVGSSPLEDNLVERGVAVPMRDGTILRADVYRPRMPGRYPVLVERTPYSLGLPARASDGAFFPRHGYVYVAQNVRGRFASVGRFEPLWHDGTGANQDGFDTIEWAAVQPWSSGDVVLTGGSYAGGTAYLAATTRPPHLQAVAARQGLADAGSPAFYRGGVHQLFIYRDWILRAILLAELEHESAPPELLPRREQIQSAHEMLQTWLRHLPLTSFPPIEGLADWYFAFLAHPQGSSYWQPIDVTRQVAEMDVPILHLSGWFDPFFDGALRCFNGIRQHGKSARCRAGQRLIVGPWVHWAPGIGKRYVGELDFGPQAEFDYDAERLRWYDYWLKGEDADATDDAPIRIFLMGDNRWLDLAEWPPPEISYQPLYLHAGAGPSAESLNNGRLSFAVPAEGNPSDRFVYDPADPVPSLVRYPLTGPYDHRPIEARLLTYTSDVLERDCTLIGPVKAILHATSSAPDTDWVVRLCDVYPDGRSMSVCDGILRARYRDSFERPELMVPGEIYQFEIDLWATAQVFKAGHRLRVQVTSSDFPRYARNLNTGGEPANEVQGKVATNTVFHDTAHASHVVLPVVLS